jgi:hypothetical protein
LFQCKDLMWKWIFPFILADSIISHQYTDSFNHVI